MKRRVVMLLTVVALAAPLLALLVAEMRVGRALERRAYDSWFTIRGELPRPEEVVLVAIDLPSEVSLGRYPWSRDYHTKLIQNLARAGAKVVAFDATFADPFPAQDTLLRQAIDETGIVLLGAKTTLIDTRNSIGVPTLEQPAGVLEGSPLGIVDNMADASDGVIREYLLVHPYSQDTVPQLGVQAVMRYLDLPPDALRPVRGGWQLGDRFIPMGPSRVGMLINFLGPPGTISTYSYSDVVDDSATYIGDWDGDLFEDHLADGTFRDKIVFVGATVPELQDLHPTPFRDAEGTGAQQTAGVEIHTHAVATILSRQHIRQLPRPYQYAWAALLAFIVVAASSKLRFVWSVSLAFGLIALAGVVSWLLFSREGLWLWTVAPVLATGLGYTGAEAVLYVTEEQEKARIRGMFSQYVASSVVDELILHPELLALGGQERVCTVLFSDVVGFSTVAEKITPTQLVALLNEYLTAMTDIVLEEGGIIDKYQGDALMAEFGVPVPIAQHQHAACRAALRMKKQLAVMREGWAREGKPELEARVGINTGQMLVGNLGSRRIMDYTVMGDHVNLGSRLEGTNKVYGTEIMASEFTWEAVKDDFVGRELDWIAVKGKETGVGVYQVLATKEEGVSAETSALLTGYADGLALYRARRFEEALAKFESLLERHSDDGPTQLLADRCREYIAHPPPEDWNGVYHMTVK
jgi:adenylate cyclase